MLAGLAAGSVPLPRPDQKGEAARLAFELARIGREGSTVAVSPDGPLGPYRRAKPGALLVARESGLLLQAWAMSARPGLRLRRRWDRHIVPLPFSRIRVFEAPPIRVGEREPLRPLLERLQGALDEVAARADALDASWRRLERVAELVDDDRAADGHRPHAGDLDRGALDRELDRHVRRVRLAQLGAIEDARSLRHERGLAVATNLDDRPPGASRRRS